MKGRLEVYKDKAGEWRWTLYAANGKIKSDSGEGYKRQSTCITEMAKTAQLLTECLPDFVIRQT